MAEGSTVNIRSVRVSRHGSYFNFIPLAEFIEFPPFLTEAQLQEIPRVTITKEQAAELIPCAVCFEEFKFNENEIRKLPCNHMYHETCIFPWLKTNQSCPACREPLPNANDNDDYFEDAIRQHLDLLTADLMRRLAESANPPLVTSANVHTSRGIEEESSSAPTVQHETPAVAETGRRVPRREAALRARRAIQRIYR